MSAFRFCTKSDFEKFNQTKAWSEIEKFNETKMILCPSDPNLMINNDGEGLAIEIYPCRSKSGGYSKQRNCKN